jgi:hypothetical protein
VVDVKLSLISHTNVGKTTLARTLLRRDVGEVLDQAHVTDTSTSYPLIEDGGDRLLLWDTPGFGDTARLLKRLKQEQNPLGWFLHQVWDRIRDRPLWCSQEAVRNVRESADVVLYLVNATEDPRGAGYVPHELEILSWIGKPTLVLLNQLGDASAAPGTLAAWREAVAPWGIVREVLSLDAFTRAWVQEDRLFASVVPLLDARSRGAMQRLAAAWRARNLAVFEGSLRAIGAFLARAARDREPLARSASRAQKEQAMRALLRRLESAERGLWDGVIADHGLDGALAAELRTELGSFAVQGEDLFSPSKGALIGGALTGALTGLAADVLAGGLSLGGGLLAGAIVGALGGAGLSKAVRWAQGETEPSVRWSSELLEALCEQCLLRYLAVAHFGRGRGKLADVAHAARWRERVQETLAATQRERRALWERGAAADAPGAPAGSAGGSLEAQLAESCTRAARSLLEQAYPGSFPGR